MTIAGVRVGIGTRFHYDGEVVEVVELFSTAAGGEVLLKDARGRVVRLGLRHLLCSGRVIAQGPGPAPDDVDDPAAVVLSQLSATQRQLVSEQAAHLREVLTGFRSGSAELAVDGEPREQYEPRRPLGEKYAAKASELGVAVRTVERWAQSFRSGGEAALAAVPRSGHLARADGRWVETALEVMLEHTGESKPSRTMVIERTRARLIARHGMGVVKLPSRATAFRLLEALERRHPTFRLSSKRDQDIADRPRGVYGKLRPTRPGEYLLMDTTRLDVFALDPVTLRWVQAELTVAMDWYPRCITGIRVTPVSTKAVDATATLYQTYRPRPAPTLEVASALTRLADHLDTHGSPIDYQRRRQLSYRDLLPAVQWQRLCLQAGAPPGLDLRARSVRSFLFERISGMPAELAPPDYAITNAPHRSALLEVPAYLTPQLLTELDNAAAEFIAAAGVHDEPITWQPPAELVSGLDLPGDDPDRVDIQALHELLRQQQRVSLSHAAERLSTSIDVIRYLLESKPGTPASYPLTHVQARKPSLAAPRIALRPDAFAAMYHDQGLSLSEIARRLHLTRKAVTLLAHEYEINLRSHATTDRRPRLGR